MRVCKAVAPSITVEGVGVLGVPGVCLFLVKHIPLIKLS